MGNKLHTEYTPLIEQNGPKKVKKTCIFLAVIVCMAAFIALGFYFKYLLASLNSDPNARADEDWALFKAAHNKKYSPFEDTSRKAIFLRNREEVRRHNSDPFHTYKKALYHFHDWTTDELQNLVGVLRQIATTDTNEANLLTASDFDTKIEAPYSVDLRSNPCMPDIKNQGQCGSCWAFAAVTPLEWQYCVKYGHKVPLSEQQLVDCSQSFGNNGCNGGLYTNAWVYLKSSGGLESTAAYPYTAMDGLCQFYKSKVIAQISAAYYTYKYDEAMKTAVAQIGPISVALFANSNFMSYHSGVFYDPTCSTDFINHGVVIVGYGTDNVGGDYWIVRNSWGPSWGLNGYILVKRGVNQCNINYLPAYPVIA